MVSAVTHLRALICKSGSGPRQVTALWPPKVCAAMLLAVHAAVHAAVGGVCVMVPRPALAQAPEHAAPELPNPDVPTAMELEATSETGDNELNATDLDATDADATDATDADATDATDPDAARDATSTELGPTDASEAKATARPTSLSLPGKSAASNQRMFGSFEGTYGLGGVSIGTTFAPGGLVLGGELSVVRQTQEFYWFGGYVDSTYDFNRKQFRISVGPELGWSALGLDAGYLLVLDGETARSGVTARPLVSIGYVTAYGRVSHLFDDRTWLEAGLLLKYPVEF